MNDETRKLVGFFVATVVVGGALVLFLPGWLGSASGPETELVTQLKQAERDGLELAVPKCAGQVHSRKLSYQRISVTADASSSRALVTATLDFEGSYGPTTVSSLGLERIPFQLKGSDWVPVDGLAPRLSSIISALEMRRRSLEAGAVTEDAGTNPDLERLLKMTDRQYRSNAWYVRSEREDVTVTEDYRLQGTLPDQPVDDKASVRLKLQASPNGEFFFPNGIL